MEVVCSVRSAPAAARPPRSPGPSASRTAPRCHDADVISMISNDGTDILIPIYIYIYIYIPILVMIIINTIIIIIIMIIMTLT